MKPSHRFRFRVAGVHFVASAVACAAVSAVVFLLWYPSPFAAIAGGATLILLLIGIDLVLGPILTAVVADPRKKKAELIRDVAAIVAIQLTAFAYGVHSLALARPVVLAFEIDRMRLISAADIDSLSLADAPTSLQTLSWTGPRVVAAVKPADQARALQSIEWALSGIDLAMVPANWRDWNAHRDKAWATARPIAHLIAEYPQSAAEVASIVRSSGHRLDELRFLPLQSRKAVWVTVLAPPNGDIVGHLPFEGFF